MEERKHLNYMTKIIRIDESENCFFTDDTTDFDAIRHVLNWIERGDEKKIQREIRKIEIIYGYVDLTEGKE